MFTNPLGDWDELGEITPALYQWVEFPIAAVQPTSLFRLEFSPPFPRFNLFLSKLWLRSKLTSGEFTRATLIYPKFDEATNIEYEFPQDLTHLASWERTIEVKKVARYRRSIAGITNWKLRLYQLRAS